MSIRLAASQPVARLRPSGDMLQRMRHACVNDNAADTDAPVDALGAALRLFAEHGLAAARHAAERALASRAQGDAAEFCRWRAICRTLDRGLAQTLDKGGARRGLS